MNEGVIRMKSPVWRNPLLGKVSKKKNLEFSRFSGWVGLKKSIFQIKTILSLLGTPNFRGIPLILGVSPLILGVTPLKLGVPPDMNVGYLVKKVLEKLKKIFLY